MKNNQYMIYLVNTSRMILLSMLVFYSSFILSGQDTKSSGYLNIGYSNNVFTEINVNDIKSISNILSDQIINKIKSNNKVKSNTIIIENSNQLISLVNANKLDIIGLSGLEYLEVSKKCKLQPIGVHYTDNSPYEEFVIIANGDKGINSLNDLKNKNITISYKDKKLISLWLDYLIEKKIGQKSSEFFSEINTVEKTNSAIMQVLLGQKDAALVAKKYFIVSGRLNNQISKKLIIVEESPGLVMGMVCVRSNMEDQLTKERVIEEIMNLHKSKTGQQILKLFLINQLIDFKEEYLQNHILINNFFKTKLPAIKKK